MRALVTLSILSCLCVGRTGVGAQPDTDEVPPEIVSKLVSDLVNAEWDVNMEGMIPVFKAVGPSVAPALLRELKKASAVGSYNSIQGRIQSALTALGPEAIPVMVKEFGDPDEIYRNHVAWAAGGMKRDALPALREALKNADPNVRWSACQGLREMRKDVKEVVPDLIGAMEDKDSRVRLVAIVSLYEMREQGIEAAPALTRAVQRESGELREAAFQALRGIGPAAIPSLSLLIESKDGEVKAGAVEMLTIILADDKKVRREVVAPLVVGTGAEDAKTRLLAVHGLANVGPIAKEAVPRLIALLDDPDASVRANSVVALGRLGKDSKTAVPELVRKLNDTHCAVRCDAADALEKIGGKEALGAVGEYREKRHECGR